MHIIKYKNCKHDSDSNRMTVTSISTFTIHHTFDISSGAHMDDGLTILQYIMTKWETLIKGKNFKCNFFKSHFINPNDKLQILQEKYDLSYFKVYLGNFDSIKHENYIIIEAVNKNIKIEFEGSVRLSNILINFLYETLIDMKIKF